MRLPERRRDRGEEEVGEVGGGGGPALDRGVEEANLRTRSSHTARKIFFKIKILHKREDENECAVSTPANSCPLHSAKKKIRQKMALPIFFK